MNVSVELKIEPKTFFANERTFMQWASFCVTLQSIGVAFVRYFIQSVSLKIDFQIWKILHLLSLSHTHTHMRMYLHIQLHSLTLCLPSQLWYAACERKWVGGGDRRRSLFSDRFLLSSLLTCEIPVCLSLSLTIACLHARSHTLPWESRRSDRLSFLI